MCQGQRGDQEEKAESKRAHLQPSVIWTEKSLPTFTRKAAKGDLEISRYKVFLMQIVLAPGELPKITISWAPGLFVCVLTHRILLYCLLHLSMLTTSDYCSFQHTTLWESWLLNFTHCCSASKTASRFRPLETSSGISPAVTTAE